MKISYMEDNLKKGDKVRRRNWGRYFIKLIGNYFEDSERRMTKLSALDVFADDWEVVE